ncbi:hypothetical protein BTO05_06425 [Winogradskyella sp. PC-19]|jgi:Spy/CpxP family protein refolding chaperone|uniref:hypothetical protein n=1 Tax=unclassified Winogradskyella TaxID=2615021 RepID=UPI000B3D01F4|nr:MULTISPECIES: hypothetical protein [unclassified Winogradskyella]ARV09290.1 hypothetical protein BTO05_06425 [Winogradskyella sp. PC-19]RZN74342.1 MAG: hypothetical protein EVB12_08535 [Winogradskyella sp.]
MKKLVVIALSLFTFTGFAQKINKEKMSNAVEKRMYKKGKASPKAQAEIESKQMTLQLDLTKQQQTKVENALLGHYEIMKERKDAVRKSDKKLTPEQRTKMKSEHLDAQITLKAEMKTILNAEQYAKYSQMMERKMKNRRGKGKRRK